MPTEWILEQFSPFRSIYVSARVVSLPRWKVECLSSLRPRNRVNCPNRKPLGHVKVSAGKNQKRTRARTSKVQEAGSTQKQQNESVLAKNPPSPALPLALPLSLLLALPGLFSPALAVDEPRENSGETQIAQDSRLRPPHAAGAKGHQEQMATAGIEQKS